MDARSDVDKETENQRAELRGHQHLNARGILARTLCRHCPHGVPCPFRSFLSDRWRQPDFEDRKRARQKFPWLMAENGNACTTCGYLSLTPGFFAPFYYCQCLCPSGQRCSNTNDGSFERRLVSAYNVYLHILCMIEPDKGTRFSSSVKHLHNMHLSAPSPQIQIWTTNTWDGLLMVAQRKGASNIHRILARFMHIWDQHMYAPEIYCPTFSAEPASDSPLPLINHGWRTVAIRWDPSNGPTFTFNGRSFPTNFKMGHAERPLNWNIWKFSLRWGWVSGSFARLVVD